jgi:hypothetical protein
MKDKVLTELVNVIRAIKNYNNQPEKIFALIKQCNYNDAKIAKNLGISVKAYKDLLPELLPF